MEEFDTTNYEQFVIQGGCEKTMCTECDYYSECDRYCE